MGIKEKTNTEDKKFLAEETVVGREEIDIFEPTLLSSGVEQSSTLPRLDILMAILGGIDATPQL